MRYSFMRKSMIILFWLCIWQLVAVMTHNDILLVGPFQVGRALLENMARVDFIRIVLCSAGRIGLGFFAALFCALLCGALSYRYALLEEFLSPVITMLKSIPVASFVVLLLIWFGSAGLSFFISFLIVFPNVYVNTIAGLKSTDRQLLEMAEVFGIGGWNRFCFLYRPALVPYLTSCLKVSLGMSWKSGVAAEVIGIPQYSLGERLYMSKIYLDTAGLFAWTLLVILLSFLFEKAVLYLLKKLENWKPCPSVRRRHRQKNDRSGHFVSDSVSVSSASADSPKAGRQDIHIRHIGKSYGEQLILEDFSLTMKAGGRYCLMAPS
ncbi:MAG: ABC transporter permease subunit, partial [Lachnospiraceae bacterium]|nr:ABC transporter permease subunit [Lachnospiraceae bacterium]